MPLTDAEIIELEELLQIQEIHDRRNALKDHFDRNPNYSFIVEAFNNQKYTKGRDKAGKEIDILIDGYRGVVLEGSSRSGKTFSTLEFFIYLGLFHPKKLTINIVKETYNEFKTTLYDDWRKLLDYYDLPNPFYKQEVHSFRINGSKINLIGADKSKTNKFHGVSCDILYFNEGLSVSNATFDQSEMRCRMFWIIDYNPSVTEHWIFKKVITRPDVGFLRTTFLVNKHISIAERNKILSYEPWEPGSYEVEESTILYNGKPVDDNNQPPPHTVNVKNGTADKFMWKVYGLGLRGAMKGLIFPHVTYIDKFPDHIAHTYGMDLGFLSDPLAFIKGGEDANNIYIELLWYSPLESPQEIDAMLTSLGISKNIPITCDSSDRHLREGQMEAYYMVRDLFNMGWEISKVVKNKNVMFWIASMKQKKIHIVRNHLLEFAKIEQENYRLKEINGISINQPEDKHNHCFTGDTLITTINGQKRIDSIVIGDLVLTRNGYQSVVETFNNGVKKIYSFRIKLDTFSLTLKSTDDHLIKTESGWTKISELKKGQTVYLSNSSIIWGSDSVRPFAVAKIDSELIKSEIVYDIAVKNTHEYFANGLLVHNCWDAARYNHMAHNTLGSFEVEWD